jgi:hypothetical protein
MSPTGWGLKTGPPVSDESLVVHHRWIRCHFRARYPNPIAIRLKNWLLSKDQNSPCRSRYKTAAVGGVGRPTWLACTLLRAKVDGTFEACVDNGAGATELTFLGGCDR